MTTDRMSPFEAATHERSPKCAIEDQPSYVFVSGSPELHHQAFWRHIEEAGHTVRRFTEDRALLDAVRAGSPSATLYEIPARHEGAIQFLNQLTELKHDACVIVVGPEIGAELRLRRQMEQQAFEADQGIVRMTASIGIAHIPDVSIRSVSDWIGAADSTLYDAKVLGRNRVVAHVPDQALPVESAVLTLAA